MKQKCVTIIIPIYNNANSLSKCIQSVIDQSYHNLHIVLVNDGSSDNSGVICEQFAKMDSRIEVYHQENKGVSDTRNFALTKVKGDYVQFIDGDDYIATTMIQHMVEKMEKENADMVICNYGKVFQKMYIPNTRMDKSGSYAGKEYLCKTLKNPGHHYYGVVWNKIYKRAIIEENQITFEKNVNLGEDFIFNMNYWLKCEKVVVTGKYLYMYNKTNEMSLSQIKHKMIEDCQHEFKNRKAIYKHYVEAFIKIGLYEKYKEDIQFYWIIFLVRQMYSIEKEYVYWAEEEKKRWKKQMEEDEDIRRSLQQVSQKRIGIYQIKYCMEYWVKRILKKWGKYLT